MGKYPEAEDREAADGDDAVIDLEAYRQRRAAEGRDTDANQKPREAEAAGAGARNASVESDHRS